MLIGRSNPEAPACARMICLKREVILSNKCTDVNRLLEKTYIFHIIIWTNPDWNLEYSKNKSGSIQIGISINQASIIHDPYYNLSICWKHLELG